MSVGFGASMDAIAKQASVSKQTLYSHYPNKRALFQAVITGKCDQYFDEANMPRGSTLHEELMDRGQRMLEMMSDENVQAMMRAVAANVDAHPDVAEHFYQAGPSDLCRRLQSTFERHDPTAKLGPADENASGFVHALAGHLMTGAVMQPKYNPQTPRDHLARTVERFCR